MPRPGDHSRRIPGRQAVFGGSHQLGGPCRNGVPAGSVWWPGGTLRAPGEMNTRRFYPRGRLKGFGLGLPAPFLPPRFFFIAGFISCRFPRRIFEIRSSCSTFGAGSSKIWRGPTGAGACVGIGKTLRVTPTPVPMFPGVSLDLPGTSGRAI